MTMIQNIGMAGLNWVAGRANDLSHAGPENPGGYRMMLQLFTALAVLGVVFAFLLRRRERGPCGHGLETITTSSSR
jgi:MYXO-CTERM domain-containing protein